MASLPESIKAQVLREYNQPYTLETVPVPSISTPQQVLIKVNAAGYYHTDAALAVGHRRGDPRKFAHIGGHEMAGTVIKSSETPSSVAEGLMGVRAGVPGRGNGSCEICFEYRRPGIPTLNIPFFVQLLVPMA